MCKDKYRRQYRRRDFNFMDKYINKISVLMDIYVNKEVYKNYLN